MENTRDRLDFVEYLIENAFKLALEMNNGVRQLWITAYNNYEVACINRDRKPFYR